MLLDLKRKGKPGVYMLEPFQPHVETSKGLLFTLESGVA